jgi:hypothetical protein
MKTGAWVVSSLLVLGLGCSSPQAGLFPCDGAPCAPSCTIGTTQVSEGAANPENLCQSCQPGTSLSTWTDLSAGVPCADGGAICVAGICSAGCAVGGVIYRPGDPNPVNVCETCQPRESISSFSPATGPAVGGSCGSGSYCYQGTCSGGCSIGGTSYAPGDPDPSNPCVGCVPGVSATAWSNLPSGTQCSSGVCSNGICLYGCDIGGVLFPPGTGNPENVCQSCQPALSSNSWSPLTLIPAGGCNGGQVCLDGGCLVGCYIGQTFYDAGQRKAGDDSQCCSPATVPADWSPAFEVQTSFTDFLGPFTFPSYGNPQVVTADFNGDRRPDVAILGNTIAAVIVYLNDPDGGFVESLVNVPSPTYSLAAGDLDRDGFPDLVVAGQAGEVLVLMNRGDGTFGDATPYDSNLSYYDAGPDDGGLTIYYESYGSPSLALADVNGDGTLDVLIAGGGLSGNFGLLGGIGDGGLKPVVTFSPGTVSTYLVSAADVDGDGAPDLLVLGDTGISVDSYPPYEVIVWTYGQAIYLMHNDGQGGFGSPVPVSGFYVYEASGLTTGQFNGDGNIDLAVARSVSPTQLEILLGLGDGGFSGPAYYSPDYYARQLLVGDFNGDGHPDLVLGGNPASLFLNRGDGTFSPGATLSSISHFGSGAVADFNGDGLDDLAIEDTNSILTIWLNNCR